MKDKDFKKLVKKYHGWIEGSQAFFPSVFLKNQFVKEYEISQK